MIISVIPVKYDAGFSRSHNGRKTTKVRKLKKKKEKSFQHIFLQKMRNNIPAFIFFSAGGKEEKIWL